MCNHASFRPDLSDVYGIILLFFVFLLRISAAAAVSPENITENQLGFRPSKRYVCACWRPATPFIALWLDHVKQHLLRQGPFSQTHLSWAPPT